MKSFRHFLRMALAATLLLPAATFTAFADNIAKTVAAETPSFNIRTIDVHSGLSQNTVLAIIQDKTGFIWFGTKDGLCRFDGQEIRKFSPAGAIAGNDYVIAMCCDPSGKIWIGTDAGLCLYDPLTETETRLPIECRDGSLCNDPVTRTVLDGTGENIWIPLRDKGVCRISVKDLKSEVIGSSEDGSVKYEAYDICFSTDGTAYMNLGDGNIWMSSDGLRSAKPLFPITEHPFRGMTIDKIIPVNPDRLLICTRNGLFSVYTGSRKVKQIPIQDESPVHDALEMPDGDLFIATDARLILFDKDFREKPIVAASAGSVVTPEIKAIYSLCLDNHGGVWAGSYFDGAYYLREDKSGISKYFPVKSGNDYSVMRVREIVESEDGEIWFGTEDKKMFRLNPGNGQIQHIDLPELPYNVHGLCCDGDYIWIGPCDMHSQLIRMHRKTFQCRKYPDAGSEIFSICRTASEEIYVSGAQGVRRLDRAAGAFVPVSEIPLEYFIFNIREDRKGYLWMASFNDGLIRYDPESHTTEHYRFAPEYGTEGLPSNKVLSTFEDSRGRLWVTTQGGGVCHLDPADSSFVRYPDALPYTTVYRIEEDRNSGILYMSTNSGLVRFDPSSGQSRLFTDTDGLLCNQFNYSSSLRSSSGKIYMGCTTGLISFNPELLKTSEHRHDICLYGFALLDRDIEIGGPGSPLKKSITYTDAITLGHRDNSFTLKASILDCLGSGVLRYRLDGLDPKWHQVTGNTIQFHHLPAGSFTLKVAHFMDNSDTISAEKDLKIRIRPRPANSTGAYIIYAILMLCLSALITYIVRKRIKDSQSAEIERIKREKERELYAAKFDWFTNLAHEIRTPLSLINGPLDSIEGELKDNAAPDVRDNLKIMRKNAERLQVLITQLLDFKKAEIGGFRINPALYNIGEILKSQVDCFTPMAAQKKISLTVSLPDHDVYAVTDREAMIKTISNMLSNAVKYSGSYARLSLEAEEDRFRIILENDGMIIPLERRESIFQPFVQYNEGRHNIVGTGIGLSLARTLTKLQGGTLSMDSDLTVNRFILSLPLVVSGPQIKEPEDTPAEDDAWGMEKSASQEDGHAQRILVAEDNEDMLFFLSSQLKNQYSVTGAQNGKEALKIIEDSDPFDLVISDIMMPVMDGMEFCRQLKNDVRFCHIPVILLTARTDMGAKVMGLDLGADAYISKPFSLEYLRASISALIENRERIKRHFSDSPFSGINVLIQSKADGKFLDKLGTYVTENMAEPDLSVDDMASHMCMSTTNFRRKLKGIAGLSPNEFLRVERLKRSAELLQEGEYSIADIAVIIGFGSSSYFATCFKKQFGMSPNKFVESLKREHSDE